MISNGINAFSKIGLSLLLIIPSLGQVQKYTGSTGVAIYSLAAFLAIFFGIEKFMKHMTSLSEKQAFWLILLTLTALALTFMVIYPIVDAGLAGRGSDNDDDLNLVTRRLLQGQYPYYGTTYLKNPLGALPGAALLAIPFVMMGNSAYQNLFWILAFLAVLWFYLRDIRQVLSLLWIMLFICPVFPHQILTGNTELANSLYVLVFMVAVIESVTRGEVPEAVKVGASIMLGIALSSRANFLLLSPLLFFFLFQNAGLKKAFQHTLLTTLSFTIVTLPFFLYDSQGFSALHIQFDKVAQFQSVMPFAGLAIPIGGLVLALVLSFEKMRGAPLVLFRNCAFVQAFPILSCVLLYSLKRSALNFHWAGYGVFFLFFGLLAASMGRVREKSGKTDLAY